MENKFGVWGFKLNLCFVDENFDMVIHVKNCAVTQLAAKVYSVDSIVYTVWTIQTL